MRYRLRTLLIVVAVGPPLIAALWFDSAVVLMVACYLGFLALLFPAASYLA